MEASSGSSNRILIVDEEVGVRATLTPILQRNGFLVRTVASVRKAVDEIHNHHFDGLICDLKLGPNEDPYVAVRVLRQVNPSAAVIIFTGYPQVETAIQAIRQAVDDYIIKPTSPDKLVGVLRDRITQRRKRARILSLSYDEVLLRTRNMLLEQKGYEVVSAQNLESGLAACESGPFDVFVLGHSIPQRDKQQMVRAFARVVEAQSFRCAAIREKSWWTVQMFKLSLIPSPC